MDIVLCADDNYAMPCGVCLTSLFENNRDAECNVYILTVGFSETTNALFTQLAEKYQQTIQIVPIDSSLFQNLKVSDRFRESIYYRFLISDFLFRMPFMISIRVSISKGLAIKPSAPTL